jgi:uncharacterized membrane protein
MSELSYQQSWDTDFRSRQKLTEGMSVMKGLDVSKWVLPTVAVVGLVVATLPGVASAQDCDQRRSDNRTSGAIVGAVAGGALGGATSGHRQKGLGTVAGALLGAALGSSVGGDNTRCYSDRYAYDDGPPPPPAPRYDDRYYDDPPPPPPRVIYERVYEPAPPPPPPRVVVYERTYVSRPVYHHSHYREW